MAFRLDSNIPRNRKEIPVGSVAYFIRQTRHRPGRYITFGIVQEHYPGEVCVGLVEPRDTRKINGIPYKEFHTPTEKYKLPKGWTWDTKLFEETSEHIPELDDLDCKSPESIMEHLENGSLVYVSENDNSVIKAVVDGGRFHLTREYPSMYSGYPSHKFTYWNVPFTECYASYQEAEQELDRYFAEQKRISELSDYDYSVEEIDSNLARYKALYNIAQEKIDEYRERLLSMGRVEDIVTRISMGAFQWKYDRNKKWISLA